MVVLGEEDPVLLETEHGARGGDELNIIDFGLDYGWPQYSYGTAYRPDNPDDKPENEGLATDGFPPFFSWVPSIAPSQVLQVSGQEFSSWWMSRQGAESYGDILVSTLGDKAIHRIRIEDDSVRYSERIEIGERIRSFAELPSGKLLVGTDSGKVLLLSAKSEWSSSEGTHILK